ncbi:MAG: hypothetical protein JNK37_21110 [Verrucomicrobiales bacterium]|nr:hypothetical protein [Verrucomicrobiales bacterium]
MNIALKKKAFFPVSPPLDRYLERYGRSLALSPVYEDLHRYTDLFPLFDREGNDTLWKTVHYDPVTRMELNDRLTSIYALLKTGDTRVVDHLHMERVDFCDFGNSRPFRIRIVNNFNDNYDHFYVKVADSSRIYGLELEHILSPNRINYLVNANTLIEEHIAGIPGDAFIRNYFDHPDTNRVRIAKEFVKFSERCFCRLLGDMRSYNYVVDITPDFEEVQYRVRAIDFDQQSYEGSKEMYLTQFIPENRPVVQLCTELLNYPTMQQYQNEERTLIARRVRVAQPRLEALFACLRQDDISTPEKVAQLSAELGEFHQSTAFEGCRTMGDVVSTNLQVSIEKARKG